MTDLGLSPAQLSHAATIIGVGQARRATQKDLITAVMVALDESKLQVLANNAVPDSLQFTHDGVGGDHDSLGLFQQRPSEDWGITAELMDPATSATKFYNALDAIPARDTHPAWINAQHVQGSFDPTGSNYLAQYPLAVQVVSGTAGATAQLASDNGVTAANNPTPFQNVITWIMDPKNWQRIGIGALGVALLLIAVWKMFESAGGVTATAKVAKVFIP
jgi:hypothetical protein